MSYAKKLTNSYSYLIYQLIYYSYRSLIAIIMTVRHCIKNEIIPLLIMPPLINLCPANPRAPRYWPAAKPPASPNTTIEPASPSSHSLPQHLAPSRILPHPHILSPLTPSHLRSPLSVSPHSLPSLPHPLAPRYTYICIAININIYNY